MPFITAERLSDFRVMMNLTLGISAVVLLLPFAINNVIQGRYLLGVLSILIVGILALNAGLIIKGKFLPALVFLGVVPAVVFFIIIAFHRQGIIGALWCYPAVIAFYFMLPERQAWLANAIILALAVIESFVVFETPLALRVAATLTGVSIFSAIFIRILGIQQAKLRELAVTDSLTGLNNRTLLDASLEAVARNCRRDGSPAAIVLMDMDRFKEINDIHGHDVGDNVLKSVGKLLRDRINGQQKAFRLGGEEFLILLDHTTDADANKLAEELRQTIASLSLIPGDPVTASFGVAMYQEPEGWASWFKRCDENLYRAKTSGRNVVAS